MLNYNILIETISILHGNEKILNEIKILSIYNFNFFGWDLFFIKIGLFYYNLLNNILFFKLIKWKIIFFFWFIIFIFDSRKFTETIPKSFAVRYDSYTQSINIIDSKNQIESLVYNVNQEVQILMDALRKFKQ